MGRKDNYAGWALLELANAKDAAKCVKNLKMSSLDGNKIWASFNVARKAFDRKEEMAGETNGILVGGVHWTVTGENLKKMCSEFGEVAQVIIWYDMSGYTRGIATVFMGDADAATKAFDGLNGKKVNNLTMNTCYTKHTEKKPDKKKIKKKNFKTKVIRSTGLEKKMSKINFDKKKIKRESKTGKSMKKKRERRRSGNSGRAKFA